MAVTDGTQLTIELDDVASVAESFDVLVVVTSSYGDGEPPANFNTFLVRLLKSAEQIESGALSSKPLAGLQHAVLGEGSSDYETFQNCPRLTDKYLEACGSRRFVPRHETDVAGDDEPSVSRDAFREAVYACLKEGLPPADAPPAAAWSEPRAFHKEATSKISPKTVAELGGGQSAHGFEEYIGPFVVVFTAVTGGIYTYLYGW